jgi:hypothetical protein
MFTGKLWLDYVDGEYEEHWEAEVTRCILRDHEIVLEFSGRDPDQGDFLGNAQLKKQGALYTGRGFFKVRKGEANARLSLTQNNDVSCLSFSGTWQDDGDATYYDLNIELESD